MAKKKDVQSTQLPEEEALIARVDAMMDTRRPEPTAQPASQNKDDKQPPPLDIFKGVPDAPTQVVTAAKEVAGPPNLPGKATKTAAKKPELELPPEPKKEKTEAAPKTITPLAETTNDTIEPAPIPDTTIIDSQDIDQAVDEIVVREADTVLAVEDARLQKKIAQAAPPAKPHRFLRGVMTVMMVVFGVGMILVIYLALSSFL
jgi:hypothetical protein